MKKVPFEEIKPSAFFRKGQVLYQRCKGYGNELAQVVSGSKIGYCDYGKDLVTLVNAHIVEEQ